MASAWKAVSDDSRRQVLLILKEGEKSPSEIAMHFEFTLPALSSHLRILKDAGLVSERREGQRKLYSARPEGMSDIADFLGNFWDDQLKSLKQHVESKESNVKRDVEKNWKKNNRQLTSRKQ